MATTSDALRSLYLVSHDVSGPNPQALTVSMERAKKNCMEEGARLIDRKKDDARCYPLSGCGFQVRIGCTSRAEGTPWTGLSAGVA